MARHRQRELESFLKKTLLPPRTKEAPMIKKPDTYNRYHSAQDRFIKSAFSNFFAREFPKLFGPVMRERLADELLTLVVALYPETKTAFSPDRCSGMHSIIPHEPLRLSEAMFRSSFQLLLRRTLPFGSGRSYDQITRRAVARIIQEAYQQGGILSNRDVGLLVLKDPSTASDMRIDYEKKNNCVLPHAGLLHDMGSGVSHKALILRKIILEKKDPADVARETSHSQRAVDRYLMDYHRVKVAYTHNPDIDYVHLVTNLSKHLINQYLDIINHELS